jgi:hypothetical protein
MNAGHNQYWAVKKPLQVESGWAIAGILKELKITTILH